MKGIDIEGWGGVSTFMFCEQDVFLMSKASLSLSCLPFSFLGLGEEKRYLTFSKKIVKNSENT